MSGSARALEFERTCDSAGPEPRISRGARIAELKRRDNVTNFYHIAFVYAVIAGTVAVAVESATAIGAAGLSPWWQLPVVVLALVVIGASQHQLGGAIHEATHFALFADRRLNELASDWLAAFPLYTSTFHFRLHHLAHHQFINDPLRDPDWAQLDDSGHHLDFPITHAELAWALLKQFWLPNLVRYTLTRLRYSALGGARNPYVDMGRRAAKLPTLVGLLFAGGVPMLMVVLLQTKGFAAALAALAFVTAATLAYYASLREDQFPKTHLKPTIPHKTTALLRMGHMALIYATLTVVEGLGIGPAWQWYGLLWILPLFTTFPLFMIMRQWVQHGNADRGRLTNTRIFLVNPFLRYAIFPFGMDYHLPHHLYAAVPHYRLRELHELLLDDPEYRKAGVVVEGYFCSPHRTAASRNPTVIEVLGPAYAPDEPGAIHVDDAAIAEVEITDPAALAREVEQSRASGPG